MSEDLEQVLAKLGFTLEVVTETLLKQSRKMHDRDFSTAWCTFDNFEEFYDKMKSQLIVRFSTFDLFLIQVITLYTVMQLKSQGGDYDLKRVVFKAHIEQNIEKYKAILKDKWHPIFKKLEELHNSPGIF